MQSNDLGVVPVTVLSSEHQSLTSVFSRDLVTRFEAEEDVFTKGLVTTAIVTQGPKLSTNDQVCNVNVSGSEVSVRTFRDSSSPLPQGSYFLLSDQLHQA